MLVRVGKARFEEKDRGNAVKVSQSFSGLGEGQCREERRA